MSQSIGSVRTQVALFHFLGKPVAQAFQSVGTSFVLDFPPLHWVSRSNLERGRAFRGHLRSKEYLLFEGCEWQMAIGQQRYRAMTLSGRAQNALLEQLVGRHLVRARLSGADHGVVLQFEDNVSIRVSLGRTNPGEWWIGSPTRTIDAFGIEEEISA